MKKLIIYLLVILTVTVSFLFSPAIEIDCVSYVHINKYMRAQLNCDGPVFVGGAIKPSFLFKPRYPRQSRPGYILLGTMVGYPIYYLSTPFHSNMQGWLSKKLPGNYTDRSEKNQVNLPLYACVYVGYILINLVILLLSILLFEKLIQMTTGVWKNSKFLLIMLMFMLVSNLVTKSYFWTAHQQMFNILTPLLCLYIGLTFKNYKDNPIKLILLSLGAGLFVLVYGSFLLLLPTMIFSYFITKGKNEKKSSFQHVLLLAAMVACFVLPCQAWIWILKSKGVEFYSAEVDAFRQFVWVWDIFKISGNALLSVFLSFTGYFALTFGSLLFMLGLLVFVKSYLKNDPSVHTNGKVSFLSRKTLLLMGFVELEFLLFFWLLGYYADRLTFSLEPLILLYIAQIINQKKIDKKLEYILIALIILWHLTVIIFNAPHFSNLYFL